MQWNRVALGGNLTRDPQVKQLKSGSSVTEFGIAVNRRWNDKEGGTKEEVCYVDCTAFSKPGENIARFFKKGSPIFVEGRLKYDTWEDKDGGKRSKVSVTVENFSFVGKKDSSEGGEAPAQAATGTDDFE